MCFVTGAKTARAGALCRGMVLSILYSFPFLIPMLSMSDEYNFSNFIDKEPIVIELLTRAHSVTEL